jgi:hypothetical protein
VKTGRVLAVTVAGITLALIVAGTLWPNPSALAFAGGDNVLHSPSTPEAAAENLAQSIGHQDWGRAYSSLSNKAELTEQQFVHDLTEYYPSLRTYATLQNYELRPLHATANEAEVELRLHWSTVVGTFTEARSLRVVKIGDRWEPEWPLVKEAKVPPQVIAVNYLRWDVIYRGPGDDWGTQDVEAPHVRIVDMHPAERSDGVVILGELLNEDVVPAYVSVKATLLKKNGSAIATEESFDKISHLLLPKQVTPFLITFADASLSDVASVRMDPVSTLVSASADPVIEIEDQKLNPAPDASLSGQLVNQSGQVVNIAHVLATFYGKGGQPVWVADQYIDRALLPQTPVPFNIHIPQDLARQITSERAVTASYSSGGLR